jgi:thymidylate kinase
MNSTDRDSFCGDVESVRMLLANDTEVNARDFQGRTALGLAKEQGDEKVVNALDRRDTDEITQKIRAACVALCHNGILINMERPLTNASIRVTLMNGHLIVFEGPDAEGKSTLLKSLQSILQNARVPTEFLSFPGDRPGTLGKLVYELHHSLTEFGINGMSPIRLQALHIAAHVDTILQTIIPALSSGTWIVLHRFWWSTWVCGAANGIEPRALNSLIEAEKLVWGPFQSSVVFLVERSAPLRNDEKEGQFKRLSSLSRELCDSQRKIYPVVELVNMELESAQIVIT